MITEGLLVRHCGGSLRFRDGALIDIAQDYALDLLHRAGLFDLGLVFKGGTALRKFRLGIRGRFSTDLDLAVAEPALAELVFETLDGKQHGGFAFSVEQVVVARRARLHISSHLGAPTIQARIDIAHRLPWMQAEPLVPLEMPIHKHYDFQLGAIPIIAFPEGISEKLARYRRASLARDLYDLAMCAAMPLDRDLVRRLAYLKIWSDVVDDGLGRGPISAQDILRARRARDFSSEQIGHLTIPVDVEKWILQVQREFQFLTDVVEEERFLLEANPGDRRAMLGLVQPLRAAN